MQTLAQYLASRPFELILSSGFFGFFAHAGFLSALEEAGLHPALVGGSSAGALVGGLWAAGVSADAIRARLFSLRREAFWDLDPYIGLPYYARKLPLLGRFADALTEGAASGAGLLRGHAFVGLLRELLEPVGSVSFSHCRYPLRVVAFDLDRRRTKVLTDGDVALALRASCAFPGLLQPVHIAGTRYLDGGISDRPGLSAATPGARVLFHHLPTTSPWRRVLTAQNGQPARPGTIVLTEPGLPQLSPFHLERGPEAFRLAREMTLRALAAAHRDPEDR